MHLLSIFRENNHFGNYLNSYATLATLKSLRTQHVTERCYTFLLSISRWTPFVQETLSLVGQSCFLSFGTYGLALVNQIFASDFCLAGVPLQMNDVCKLRIHVFKTTAIRPNYKKVLDCSQSHISKLRIRISWLRTEMWGPQPRIFRLRTDQKSCYEPKFAWAKNNHETTKLAGVQYAVCPVICGPYIDPEVLCRADLAWNVCLVLAIFRNIAAILLPSNLSANSFSGFFPRIFRPCFSRPRVSAPPPKKKLNSSTPASPISHISTRIFHAALMACGRDQHIF